ncbi:MAG TPA: hypothetical protein VOA80_14960 [Thermoanaerobaculia bacterium]|nr:hypothetical protein [Thermoanaerobaculia bacterium]
MKDETRAAPARHAVAGSAAALPAAGLFTWGLLVALHYGRMGYLPLDQSIVFDGGYRLLSGQLPYRDFMTPAAVVPAALQAGFFRVLGVSWFSYVLHAAVANGLFAALAFALLRQCGLRPAWAAWWAALSALTFYPPIGVPYAEHHAFLFGLAALAAGNAARRTRGDAGALLWSALAAILLAAAFFSKSNPAVFLAPLAVALPLLRVPGRRRLRNLCGLLLGTAGALAGVFAYVARWVPDPGAARRFALEMPAAVGAARIRLLLAGRGPGWPFWRPMLTLWPLASLVLALTIALHSLLARHGDGERRLAAFLALGLTAVSAAFVATTLRSPVTAAAYVFLVAGLAQASLARGLSGAGTAAADEPSPGRPPGAAPPPPRARIATAMLALLLTASAVEAVRFDLLVNEARAGIDAPPAAAAATLPTALRYLRWGVPPFVHYGSGDLAEVAGFFASHPGNFWLLGDSSILYGITGRPSVSPVLWFHPYLTVPFAGRQQREEFDRLLRRHLRAYDIRYVVLEGEATQMGVSLATFPVLKRRVDALRCGEETFGGFRIITLCRRF